MSEERALTKRQGGGWRRALGDLAGALLPLSLRNLRAEVAERLKKIPNRVNEYGYDAYGLSPGFLEQSALPMLLLYRYYFRARTFDIDRLPSGRMLLIANHAGQLPIDGAMLGAALLLEAEPPRVARAMAEYFLPRLPWLGTAVTRGGAMVGTPSNCVHMLENEECVMVFPEGVRGISKPFSKRYQLQRMGLGFMRLALETRTPIVPVGIVGSEEQMPGLANFENLARTLNLPSLPLPATLLPLPARYSIYFGEPIHFEGDPTEEDAVIQANVDQVRGALEALLARGLRERKGVFF